MEVTISLPEEVYRRAERFAKLTGQGVDEVVADAVTSGLPLPNRDFPELTRLSDQDVLRLAESVMEETESARLSELLDTQQAGLLTPQKREELDALMAEYNFGLLVKARAMTEAVRRGLVPPLEP